MDEKLKHRFFKKKMKDFVNDHNPPFPTIICEMERIYIMELVRRNCLFAKPMKLFTSQQFYSMIEERLDIQKETFDYGDLYILVTIN